jgi:hypothetical protein
LQITVCHCNPDSTKNLKNLMPVKQTGILLHSQTNHFIFKKHPTWQLVMWIPFSNKIFLLR